MGFHGCPVPGPPAISFSPPSGLAAPVPLSSVVPKSANERDGEANILHDEHRNWPKAAGGRARDGGEQRAHSPLVARLRNYLLAGIIVTAPISITFFIVWQVVDFFDETASNLIPARYNPETYLPFSMPGLGFLFVLALITLVGWFTASLLGRSMMRFGERILQRMPVVRSIYGTLKQIFETVLANSSRSFREVVLVEYPRRGLWAIAFVTGPTKGEVAEAMGEEDLVNVFLPTTPNPTSGFLLFVPRRDLVHLGMTIEEGMKMVISGGIVTPPGPEGVPAPVTPPQGTPVPATQLARTE